MRWRPTAAPGMAAFKRPRRVVVVEGLPKTPTGKIRRFALRNALAAGEL